MPDLYIRQARNQLSPKGGGVFFYKHYITSTHAIPHWLTCEHKHTRMNARTNERKMFINGIDP